ncbi:MAG: segregation/condensation protein A, partial [Patescibacteria group bacterium]
PEDLSINILTQATLEMLTNLPLKQEVPKTVVKKIISLEEMMENLAKRIQNNLKMSFKNYADKEEKINAIVGFLALLELVKRGVIAVKQNKNFADIEMEHNSPGVPNYN